MLVLKNNLLYFIKLKSVWITNLILFIFSLCSNILVSLFIFKYDYSKIVYFWFSYSLILLQIAILNIQLFIVIFFEHKKIGLLDLEIRKGIKKQYVFIYRLLASFIITLSVYLINIIFYYAIVLPTLIPSSSAISLLAYGILTIILFDIVFKTFMTFLTIMKKAALGISLGSIIGAIVLMNPVLTLGFSAPLSAKISKVDLPRYEGLNNFNNFYIASELFDLANKYNDKDNDILINYIDQFKNLSENYNGLDIAFELYDTELNVTGNGDENDDLAYAQGDFLNNIFYFSTILGLSTQNITDLIYNNAFEGILIKSSTSFNNLSDTSTPDNFEYYMDNTVVNNFYTNVLNPNDSSKDFSLFWKSIFDSNSKISINYMYKNFNDALNIIENRIDSKNKQEFIEMENILRSYFFSVVYSNGVVTYNDFPAYDINGSGISFYQINIDENVIENTLKNINPFICQIRAMLYNIFSWVYSSPLENNSNYNNLLSNFGFDNDAEVFTKKEYIDNWASEFNKNSEKYYSNPLIVYSSFIYNQGPNFLDRSLSNSLDSITYTSEQNYVNPYGPISISLDDNGQVSNLSIGHNLYYINSLVWIVPIIISVGFLTLTGYIFTKKLIS